MLTSLLRRWFAPRLPTQIRLPMCVPEWSETMAEHHASIWWQVQPCAATSAESVVALCQSLAYLETHQIPGDIVECGVGMGGNAMTAALALLALDATQRKFYLYGTSPLSDVKEAMMQTRYPWEKMQFIPGPVEATIPTHLPDDIALLQLDAGASESTVRALVHLYPRLADGGILIVANYTHTKQAVDDYLRDNAIDAELRMIDDVSRLVVKQRHASFVTAA